MTLNDQNWEDLVYYIQKLKCVPFLGAGAVTPFLPLSKDLANELAIEYGYPMEDTDNLTSVSEFLSIIKRDEQFPKKLICKKLKGNHIHDQEKFVNHIYSLLADIYFPVYFTTNYDKLLEDALRIRGREPYSQYLRWNKDLQKHIDFINHKYKPTGERPLVYHFHGIVDYSPSIVLSESDYIEFLITLGNTIDTDFLPSVVRINLASSLFLFIGYSLNDINLTVLLGNFNKQLSIPGIAVFPPFKIDDEIRKLKVHNYYEDYIFKKFKLRIFWGTAKEFRIELSNRLEKYNIR